MRIRREWARGAPLTGRRPFRYGAACSRQTSRFRTAPLIRPLPIREWEDDQLITDRSGSQNGELGLNWKGNIGGSQLETLILQRLGRATDLNASVAAALDQVFASKNTSGETIARATLRYLPMPNLTLEGGAEGAYQFFGWHEQLLFQWRWGAASLRQCKCRGTPRRSVRTGDLENFAGLDARSGNAL